MSSADLLRMVNGYQASQALHAAVALGLPDLLAGGPRSTADLAETCGAHEPTLRRLVRALAGLGVLHEDDDGRVSLTELGGPLRTDRPDSIAGWTRLIGRPYYWNTWAALTDAVRTGENGFRLLNGTDVWTWRAGHPDESAIFDGAMGALTAQVTRAMVSAYDFSRYPVVADIGGGSGALLEALLATYPGMRGVLFDQPHVVEGVAPHDRLDVVGGSFFEEVPAGADAYVLKMIIHDWEDAESVAILRAVRDAMPADGVVLVVERSLGPANTAPGGKLSDLNMLLMPGGRERSHDEYAALFEAAGLRLSAVTPAGPMDVIEAVIA